MSWPVLPQTLVLAAVGLLIIRLLFAVAQSKPRDELWTKIDTVGVEPGGSAISWFVAIAKSVSSMRENLHEGYQQFSKNDKPFVVPTMWMGGPLVVLPPSMLNLLNRPRNELSSFGALLDNAQFRYLMTDSEVWDNASHFDVVHQNLGQKDMGALADIIGQEWDAAFRKFWADSAEEKIVNAWDSTASIVARPALRVLVGLPGCKDETYIGQSISYANAVLQDACLINCLPPLVRPVAARLIAVRVRYHQWRLLRNLEPMVEERIRQSNETDHEENGSGDVIQWLIRVAKSHRPEQLTASKISQRILALTSMFIFAVNWAVAHPLLDVYCSPDRDEIVNTLTAECHRVSDEHQGLNTKQAIDALHGVDSAVRESLRINNVLMHLLPLDVLSGKPIDLGEGRQIPAGSKVRTVFPTQEMHMDPEVYPDPDRFDAFRFSREFDTAQQAGHAQTFSKRQHMTTVSTSWLPFGYGRHACPGRWFVALMVKQALAHMLLNYEVEVTKKHRRGASLLHAMLPPRGAELRVSRKTL